MEQCRSCQEMRPHDLFPKNKRCQNGRDYKCKSCHKRSYQENIEKKRAALARWRQKNPEYQKQYRQNSEKRQAYEKLYYLKNKETYHLNKIRNRRENVQRETENRREYVNKNRDKINEYHRQWKTEKRNTDIEYKLKENMSRRIRYELNTLLKTGQKKNKSTLSFISTSVEHLKTFLEGHFEIGMNWRNYGTTWQIDHIVPCSYWNQNHAFESLLCWHYKNLKPLWSFLNKSKKDKVNENHLLYYETTMKTVLFGL